MDKVDLMILSYLKENARMKASDISKEINYSISSVIERIKKMEKSGIIEKYTVQLNEKKMGNDLLVIMEISLESPKYYDGFTAKIKGNKNILSCYYLTGEYDFMLKILADSSEKLEQIHKMIKGIEGVTSTKTYFVLKEVKRDESGLPDIPEDN